MTTKKIKVVELNIVERIQLAYCGDITFEFYTDYQFTPVTITISSTNNADLESCRKSLNKKMREHVRNGRPVDFLKTRKLNGWL